MASFVVVCHRLSLLREWLPKPKVAGSTPVVRSSETDVVKQPLGVDFCILREVPVFAVEPTDA